MSRNGSGTYSVVNTFVAGTTITASDHNENWSDIAAEITNSVAVDGQSTLTGQLKASAGTAAAPSMTFGADLDSGIYRRGANELGFSTAGTAAGYFDSAQKYWLLGAMDVTGIVSMSSTSHFLPATGTTAQRPASPAESMLRYNSTTSALEVYNGAAWVSLATGSTPRGYIDGCVISNGTDTTNDINIAAGSCRDSTNAVDITVAAMTGKQLDANWAAGSAAGMRYSGAGIANTTYHIFAVAKADGTQDIYAYPIDPTVSVVLAALQAETGGADYIYARHIMSIMRLAGSIKLFRQVGDSVWWDVPASDLTQSNISAAGTSLTLTVPTSLELHAIFNANPGTNNKHIMFYSPNQTGAAPDIGSTPVGSSGHSGTDRAVTQQMCLTNTSAQILAKASSDLTLASVSTLGFIHPRGKNAA